MKTYCVNQKSLATRGVNDALYDFSVPLFGVWLLHAVWLFAWGEVMAGPRLWSESYWIPKWNNYHILHMETMLSVFAFALAPPLSLFRTSSHSPTMRPCVYSWKQMSWCPRKSYFPPSTRAPHCGTPCKQYGRKSPWASRLWFWMKRLSARNLPVWSPWPSIRNVSSWWEPLHPLSWIYFGLTLRTLIFFSSSFFHALNPAGRSITTRPNCATPGWGKPESVPSLHDDSYVGVHRIRMSVCLSVCLSVCVCVCVWECVCVCICVCLCVCVKQFGFYFLSYCSLLCVQDCRCELICWHLGTWVCVCMLRWVTENTCMHPCM